MNNAGENNIDWKQIIATRNRLVYGYLGIKNDLVIASTRQWKLIGSFGVEAFGFA
ncbi:MAG: DUF86 domain-containing protein [Gallionella sp.]|nr:DUF86 domain-containing protein [Gallionella sp.]